MKSTAAKPKLKLYKSRSSIIYKKKSPKINLRATHNGRAVKGQAVIKVSGKTVKRISLSKTGRASYTLSKKIKPTKSGKRTIRVWVVPSKGQGLKATNKAFKVKVSKTGSRVVDQAAKHVGTKYRYGGTTPSGFDCSGFTKYVYKKSGVKTLPRTSSAQRHAGKRISKKHAKPGDLIWAPGHVAIYAGGNTMIDAPRPGKTVQFRNIYMSNPTFLRVSSKAISI
ncbi:C40 family peptidase [Paraoerskovia sediminicola]|uniref:C40 family peptidase n=1 Tax=Paraoerskovia sediminicola TaxID=1138587 RepID=UPI003305B143